MLQKLNRTDCGYQESDLLEFGSGIDHLRLLVADLKLYLALKAGFDPNQPRAVVLAQRPGDRR
jgi:hypothetical protein